MAKAIRTFFGEVNIGAAVCKTAENARYAFLMRFIDGFASQKSIRFLLSPLYGSHLAMVSQDRSAAFLPPFDQERV